MKAESCALCVMGTIVNGRCNVCNAVFEVNNAQARKQALAAAGQKVLAQQQAQQQAQQASRAQSPQASSAKTTTNQNGATRTRRCKRCGQAATQASRRRCEGCGAFFSTDEEEAVQMTCTRCESLNPPGAKVCYGCGHRLEAKR